MTKCRPGASCLFSGLKRQCSQVSAPASGGFEKGTSGEREGGSVSHLQIRIAKDKKDVLRAAAEAIGEDMSDYVRRALEARLSGAAAPPNTATLVEWEKVCRVLKGAATNLNQLAHLSHLARMGDAGWPDGEEITRIADEVAAQARKISAQIARWC